MVLRLRCVEIVEGLGAEDFLTGSCCFCTLLRDLDWDCWGLGWCMLGLGVGGLGCYMLFLRLGWEWL